MLERINKFSSASGNDVKNTWRQDFDRIKDLYEWNRRVFTVVGVWPLESRNVRFCVAAFYFFAHIMLEMADLMNVIGNLELVVANILESSLQSMIFIKFVSLKFSQKMRLVLKRLMEALDPELFDNERERQIYLTYNRSAKTFVKIWLTMGAFTAVIYYIKPVQLRFEASLRNETASLPFTTAYRIRTFFEINDTTTFYLVWICEAPLMYWGFFHTATIGFLFSLTSHACGQLSVLSFRINNLRFIENNHYSSHHHEETPSRVIRSIFQDIVERHRSIIELSKDINDVFGWILLEELVVTTVLIGLTSYSALVSIEAQEGAQFLAFVLYGATLLFLIYGYCAAGEYLYLESANLYAAYYQCPWYDMSDSVKKQLIICMIGSSKPLRLSAGGFYAFSLVNFMGIVKTAAGYISMLRTMV